MSFYSFALISNEWGVARFLTDSIALIALGIFIALPFQLLKHRLGFKEIWSDGNALSSR